MVVPPEGREQQNSASDFQAPEDVREEQMDLSGLVVIAHPSNPVNELTTDQIRKIYSGELTNWNQVGGPDIAVKVMTVGGTVWRSDKGDFQRDCLCFREQCLPGCGRQDWALGFIPKRHSRQLRFLGTEKAIKNNGGQD